MAEVQARTVLWHLVFFGFIINFLVCINLNITIVEMVALSTQDNSAYQSNVISIINGTVRNINSNNSDLDLLKTTSSTTNISVNFESSNPNNTPTLAVAKNNLKQINNVEVKTKIFAWNEKEQALALGSFFWTHWMTQIPGGILARKYGTKLIFGLSNVISCWICFFIPIASYSSLSALTILRMLQGLLTGLSWPAMHHMTAKWIPPNERSKFVTAYFGSAVGIAFAYPLFAWIIHWFSWPWVFHVCGIAGTLWWFCWLYLAYDGPAQHPRISSKELTHIERSLKDQIRCSEQKLKTPWLAIATSKSVWMNVIGQWAGVWSVFTVMTQAPTYFKVMHNWDIRAAGIFAGLPHLMRMIFAYSFSLYADYLLRSNKMSRTNVRKMATGIACIVNGLFMLALSYFGHNAILAVTFITLATMCQGAGTSGPLSSMIDIAPNFAGIISGVCGTIGCMPGFISAYLVGVLTLNNQTFDAWTNVFLICAGVLISCGLLYICFADSTLQKWNNNMDVAKTQSKEEEPLGLKTTTHQEECIK